MPPTIYNSGMLSAAFLDALRFAAELHRAQMRKGTSIPYASHVLGVASIAMEYGADEEEAIAALLHDAVEDQGGRPVLERIRERFGERVAGIVEACTDADVQPKPPWRPRKEAYVAHLAAAPASVRLIAAADKLHNARSVLKDLRELGDALWTRFNGGREGTLWYYRAVVDALKAGGPMPLVEELDRVVSEIESVA